MNLGIADIVRMRTRALYGVDEVFPYSRSYGLVKRGTESDETLEEAVEGLGGDSTRPDLQGQEPADRNYYDLPSEVKIVQG